MVMVGGLVKPLWVVGDRKLILSALNRAHTDSPILLQRAQVCFYLQEGLVPGTRTLWDCLTLCLFCLHARFILPGFDFLRGSADMASGRPQLPLSEPRARKNKSFPSNCSQMNPGEGFRLAQPTSLIRPWGQAQYLLSHTGRLESLGASSNCVCLERGGEV